MNFYNLLIFLSLFLLVKTDDPCQINISDDNESIVCPRDCKIIYLRVSSLVNFKPGSCDTVLSLFLTGEEVKFVENLDFAILSSLESLKIDAAKSLELPKNFFISQYPNLKTLHINSPQILSVSRIVNPVNLESIKLETDNMQLYPFQFILKTHSKEECKCPNFRQEKTILKSDPDCNFSSISACQNQRNDTQLVLEERTLRNAKYCCIPSHLRPDIFEILWIHSRGFFSLNDNETFSLNNSQLSKSTTFQVQGNCLIINQTQGSIIGNWTCLVSHMDGFSMSNSVLLEVLESDLETDLIIAGLVSMSIFLLIGIFVGIIRFCKESKCFTRPLPKYSYSGDYYGQIIPIPRDKLVMYDSQINVADVNLVIIDASVKSFYLDELNDLEEDEAKDSAYFTKLYDLRKKIKEDIDKKIKIENAAENVSEELKQNLLKHQQRPNTRLSQRIFFYEEVLNKTTNITTRVLVKVFYF